MRQPLTDKYAAAAGNRQIFQHQRLELAVGPVLAFGLDVSVGTFGLDELRGLRGDSL